MGQGWREPGFQACAAGWWGFNWQHSRVSEVLMDNAHLVQGDYAGMAILRSIPGRTVAGWAPARRRTLRAAEPGAQLRLTSTGLKETEPC
jgi:hypothetical protein